MGEDQVKPVIASAVGVASPSRGPRGRAMEEAMTDAVNAASVETDVIWAEAKLSEDEKRARIAAIMDPAEIKRRMMAAREAVKQSLA